MGTLLATTLPLINVLVPNTVWYAAFIVVYLMTTYFLIRYGSPPNYLVTRLSWTNVLKFFSGDYYRGSLYVLLPLFGAVCLIGILHILLSV